jgi:hypothetical protein
MATERSIRPGRGEKMELMELQNIIGSEIKAAVGFHGGTLSIQRQQALESFYSEPMGNEQPDESQVVMSDVLEAVEWMMPALLAMFTAGDKLVDFEPTNQDDVPVAKQKSVYINHIVRKDNDGFMTFYTWFKDALLQKRGIIKTWWDDTPEETRQDYHNITSMRLTELLADPGVNVIEQKELDRSDEEIQKDVELLAQQAGVPLELASYMDDEFFARFNVTVIYTEAMGRIVIENVPPEEFLIAQRGVTIERSPFVAHRMRKTVSELVEQGYDREQLLRMAGSDGGGMGEFSPERQTRYEIDEEYPDQLATRDESMRDVWVTECFIKVDFDGDGLAEMRRVMTGGEDVYEILERDGKPDNHEVDEQPFDSICPLPIPHKFFGLSIADLTMDIQQIHSTLMRQLLNNIYNVNNARTAVWEEYAELDDFLEQRVGGYVRVFRKPSEVMMEMKTEPIIHHIVPVLQLLQAEKEERTGVTRYNQGLESQTLNETATGISKIMAAANQRIQMVGRIFAETGVKELFRRVERLVIANQDEARMLRLRDEWLPMDPQTWHASKDATIEVGLGFDTKEQQVAMMAETIGNQQRIAEAQGGLEGPIVTWQNIYEASMAHADAAGQARLERFYADPADNKPQPNGEAQAATMEAENKRMELELTAKRDQNEHIARMTEIQMKQVATLLAMKEENATTVAANQMQQASLAAKTMIDAAKTAPAPTPASRPSGGGNGAAAPPTMRQI